MLSEMACLGLTLSIGMFGDAGHLDPFRGLVALLDGGAAEPSMPISRISFALSFRNWNSSRLISGFRFNRRNFFGSFSHHDDAADAKAVGAHVGHLRCRCPFRG
jgi:hypothetical protein